MDERQFSSILFVLTPLLRKFARFYTMKGDLIYHPLTHTQQGIIMEQLRYPESMHYNLPIRLVLPLAIDADKLCRCVSRVVNSHDIWKTALIMKDGELRQYVDPSRKFECARTYMKESEIEEFQKHFVRPFNILSEPLIRMQSVTTELRHFIYIDMFHAVSDGFTVRNLGQEAVNMYIGNTLNKPFTDDLMFKEATIQKEYDESPEHKEDEGYFRDLFSRNSFNLISTPPACTLGNSQEIVKFIPHGRIREFCKEKGVKEAHLTYAAYALTLSSLTRSDDVVFLTPIHGRNRTNMKAHGTFITTNAFVCKIDRNAPVSAFVASVAASSLSLMRRRRFDYLEITRTLGTFVDTFFAYQGSSLRTDATFGDTTYQAEQLREGHKSTAPLSMSVYDYGDELGIHTECSSAWYREDFLIAAGNAFAACVEGIIEHYDEPVSCISPVSREEYGQLEIHGHTPELPGNGQFDLVGAIEESAHRNPDKPAVVSENGFLTYRELSERSGRIASGIIGSGLGTRPVLLYAYREPDTVAAMIGALKAGAAYIPTDPSYPEERNRFIREDSGAGLVLDKTAIGRFIGSDGVSVPSSASPEDTAYMIYTSGSTGRPKGVEISRRAMWSFIQGISNVLEINSDDRIACHSSFAFDASVEDLFPVLCAGGTLFITPERVRKDVSALGGWLADNSITGGNYSTLLGQLLLDACDLPSLRYIVLGGEKMTRWPGRNRKIKTFNTYGPTEFTVDATYFCLDPEVEYAEIPIGRPLPGQTVMIFDHCGNPVPFGARGEICLKGRQKASGYHNSGSLPEFGEFYRTGDIGYWNSDWNLCFVARNDSQCKLNGFRIELQEIDSCLLSVPGIVEAKSVIHPARKIICSYFVSEYDVEDNVIATILRDSLPSYMMPSCYVRLDRLPHNISGKVDVSLLPDPPAGEGLLNEGPADEAERRVLEYAREILSRTDFGVTDNLALLGMTSIQIMEFALKINKSGIASIKISDIYDRHSVRGILSSSEERPQQGWYNDNDLPVMVFFSGITSFSQIEPALKVFSSSYHIYFIPELDKSATSLPEPPDIGVRPAVVCGHSFGGELAYRYARTLQEQSCGTLPELVMFDTFLDIPFSGVELFTPDTAGASIKLYHRVHDRGSLLGYRGPIRLYAAKRTAGCESNIEGWRAVHPDIEIIETDTGHDSILIVAGAKFRK